MVAINAGRARRKYFPGVETVKTLGILLLLLPCTVCLGADCEPDTVSQLNAMCAEEHELPESLVRPASLLVQDQFLHKSWDEVRASLVEQGLTVPAGRDSQYATFYEVPVASEVLRVGDLSFDLFLDFMVDDRTKAMSPTACHHQIIVAKACLVCSLDTPTAKVISSNTFPPDSVLGRALPAALEEEGDDRYPVLKEIEISYDLIRAHREIEWPYGYGVDLVFGRDSDEQWSNSVFLTVLSTEDPPRDRDYNEVENPQGWQATALFEIQFWGGCETFAPSAQPEEAH